MNYHFIANQGYIDTAPIAREISQKLLTAEQRSAITEIAPTLTALWQEVSETCPRRLGEKRGELAEKLKTQPGNRELLEELRALSAESGDFVNARHRSAHDRYNAAAVKLAPLAVTALRRLSKEITARHAKATKLWAELAGLFSGSLDDTQMPNVIAGRVTNTAHSIADRIGELTKAQGNQAAIVLAELGQSDALPRQAASSDYCEAGDLERARRAANEND